jgi:hypothetical protein
MTLMWDYLSRIEKDPLRIMCINTLVINDIRINIPLPAFWYNSRSKEIKTRNL